MTIILSNLHLETNDNIIYGEIENLIIFGG